MDMSPKGDAVGFVRVLDEKLIAIPDRLKRADTFENLLVNPEVGIIFLIPGFNYILGVSGKGQVVRDAELQEQFSVKGEQPNLILVVTVEEAFVHCAKSIARSNIWNLNNWPDTKGIQSYAAATVEHAKLAETIDEMQEMIDKDFDTRMY